MESLGNLTEYVCDEICKHRNCSQEKLDDHCESCRLSELIIPLRNLEMQQERRENAEYYIEAYGESAKEIMDMQKQKAAESMTKSKENQVCRNQG